MCNVEELPRPAERRVITRSQQERFQTLLEDHSKILFAVTRAYCRSQEDRNDLAQEISLQLWRAFPRYDESRVFSTWMYRIALNVAISHARRNRLTQRNTISLDEPGIDPPALTSEGDDPDDRIDALRRFMFSLDELNRAVLVLYLEDHSHQRIADILGLSVSNVGTKMSRLKERIRRDLIGSSKGDK